MKDDRVFVPRWLDNEWASKVVYNEWAHYTIAIIITIITVISLHHYRQQLQRDKVFCPRRWLDNEWQGLRWLDNEWGGGRAASNFFPTAMPLHGTAWAPLRCTASMESYYSTTSLHCVWLLVVGSYFLSSVKCLGGRAAHYKIAIIIIKTVTSIIVFTIIIITTNSYIFFSKFLSRLNRLFHKTSFQPLLSLSI